MSLWTEYGWEPNPAPPHSAHRFGSDKFTVDLSNRHAVRPTGNSNSACSFITESALQRAYYYFEWYRKVCAICPLKGQCLSKRKTPEYRTLQVSQDHMIAQARRVLCRTPDSQRRMQKRNGIEGTISEIKRGYGARRTRYRRRRETDLLMQFIAAACNLRRWAVRLCWLQRKGAEIAA